MSALQNEIDKLKTLKESYHELSKKVLDTQAVLIELTHGKQEMVDALATKNVQSSTDKTLSAIADDVRSIAQSPIILDGGEVYAKQLYDSCYWNLYHVMAALLSNGSIVNYGGIVLCEYSKAHSSISLGLDAPSCGAGGAYIFSDDVELVMDKEGVNQLQVKEGHTLLHSADEVHYWNDDFDGYVDRWVAWLYVNGGNGYTISNDVIYPRKIHIGRHVGSIVIGTSTRLSEIIVTDGNILDELNPNENPIAFQRNTILRNIGRIGGSFAKMTLNSLFIKLNTPDSVEDIFKNGGKYGSITIDAPYITNIGSTSPAVAADEVTLRAQSINCYNGLMRNFVMKRLTIIADELSTYNNSIFMSSLETLYLGYITNDKSKSFDFVDRNSSPNCDVILQDGWCKNLSMPKWNMTEVNIHNNILKKLKQDEEMCGSGVTITLGATNLAKLTSEEAVALLDSLTNTYGYTFA